MGTCWYARMTGLIPARAGSTLCGDVPLVRVRAHPRPCGEHEKKSQVVLSQEGSSPPVRGALIFRTTPSRGAGLIPARAGSTRLRSCGLPWWWAHPRPCGEHVNLSRGSRIVEGSSPPVRGAPVHGQRVAQLHGLIPARAGSTRCRRMPVKAFRAHPRPCGEHRMSCVSLQRRAGSSPPVRGAPPGYRRKRSVPGLIPARAGST